MPIHKRYSLDLFKAPVQNLVLRTSIYEINVRLALNYGQNEAIGKMYTVLRRVESI